MYVNIPELVMPNNFEVSLQGHSLPSEIQLLEVCPIIEHVFVDYRTIMSWMVVKHWVTGVHWEVLKIMLTVSYNQHYILLRDNLPTKVHRMC